MNFKVLKQNDIFRKFWEWLINEAKRTQDFRTAIWLSNSIGRYQELPPLIPNKWYMVKTKGGWLPAMHSPEASNGWTNTDTWEDFDNEVTEYRAIKLEE